MKLPDLTPQKTQPVSQNPETTGSAIKKNIESVLSQKYGELDTRHIFDGIDDKDIEDNLVTAENTIKTNIDRGALSKNILPKLPNLLDGLALSYAAANKGKSKAATRAREAAYTKLNKSLFKEPENSISSIEKPKFQTFFDSVKKSTTKEKEQTPIAKSYVYVDKKESENTNTNKSFDYSKQESSKLNSYDFSDMLKDQALLSNDISDAVENYNNGDYISSGIDLIRNSTLFGKSAKATKNAARSVWKAGSELYLKPKGLTVSADMLEHSLQEKPKDVVFYEDSNVVKKIKNDSSFVTHLDEVVYKVENKIPLTTKDKQHSFEVDDNRDLYYSIHGCQFYIDNISYNKDGTKDISVHITDNYDYTKIWTSMDDKEFSPFKISLGTLANDFGTITSKLDAINPYKIDIYFTIRR